MYLAVIDRKAFFIYDTQTLEIICFNLTSADHDPFYGSWGF